MRDWRQERGERSLWRAVQSGERRGGERCSSGAYGEWRGEERRERTEERGQRGRAMNGGVAAYGERRREESGD